MCKEDQSQNIEPYSCYDMDDMRMLRNVAETAPVFSSKMEAVREVIERQFRNTSIVREELSRFREEVRKEFASMKEAWKNELLDDLKFSLAHDLQDCVRVSTMDAFTSALTHNKVLTEFGADQIKRHIDNSLSPIYTEVLSFDTKLRTFQQFQTLGGPTGEDTTSEESTRGEDEVSRENGLRENGFRKDKIPTENETSKQLVSAEKSGFKRRRRDDASFQTPLKQSSNVPAEHCFISRNTNSVLGAYHEWYTSHDDYICFQERDERYGVAWRKNNPTVGLHKRRRNLDKFIEDQTQSHKKFKEFEKEEFAEFLDLYKQREKIKFSSLCEKLGKTGERSTIIRELEDLLEAEGF